MSPLFVVLMTLLLSMTATFAIAYMCFSIITFEPVDNGDDENDYSDRTLTKHVMNCGLIYPGVFAYVWMLTWTLMNQ